MQDFIIKKAFKLAQNKLRENVVWKKSKDSSHFTVSLRKFLWSNMLNMMVQSQNLISMSHVGLKRMEILYIKDKRSLQRIPTAQRKYDSPTSLNTGFWFKVVKKGSACPVLPCMYNLLTYLKHNTFLQDAEMKMLKISLPIRLQL